MPTNSVYFGILMIVSGLFAVAVANADGKPSPTAYIPVAIGTVVALCGLISRVKENLRKHLMHVAILVALVGAGGMIGRWISAGTFTKPDFAFTNALLVQVAFTILCVAYIALGIKSFVDARRNPQS